MGSTHHAQGGAVISIYGLFDPRDDQLRYIGKSTNPRKRMEAHYGQARAGSVLHSRRWLAGLLARGLRAEVVVLECATTTEEANDAERFWIAAMRLACCDLTNLTPGGDGQPKGCRRSADAVERGAAKHRGRKRTPEQIANYKAAFNRPEERERRRQRVEVLKQNPEWLAKVRYGRTGQPCSEETKQRISAARRAAGR